MAKGELTTLRCMRIADILREDLKAVTVRAETDENLIVLTWPNGMKIVLRPISISPVK